MLSPSESRSRPALLMALALTTFTGSAHAQSYTMAVFGTLRTDGGGSSIGLGLNSAGTVVGRAQNDSGGLEAVRWTSAGAITSYGELIPPFDSTLLDITAGGGVCGYAITQPGGFASSIRDNGAGGLVNLPEPGGDSYGYAIADDGRVVGWTNFSQGCGSPVCPGNPGHACFWTNANSITMLPDLGGFCSVMTDISPDGTKLCGWGALPDSGALRGYRLVGTDGQPQQLLPYLTDTTSYAYAVNNIGDVVGVSESAAHEKRAVLWPAGSDTPINLGKLAGATNAYPAAINVHGDIVGYCEFSSGNTLGTQFSPAAAPVDLNGVVPAGSNFVITYPDDINDLGQIAGTASDGVNTRAVLLTPVPACVGDLNADRAVNTADLTILLSRFGQNVAPGTPADINHDGAVTTQDLTLLLANFGRSC